MLGLTAGLGLGLGLYFRNPSFFQTAITRSKMRFFEKFKIDIDVKTALLGVKTGPNKRICLEKISVSIRLLGT